MLWRPRMFSNFFSQLPPADELPRGRLFFVTGVMYTSYKTNSRIIRRIIRFGLVVEYHPDYQVNYQPDYRPGSTEVPAWRTELLCAAASRPDATRRPFECYTFTYMSLATAQQGAG